MSNILKSGNAKLYLFIVILVVLGALWRAGEAINAELGALPVKVAPKLGSNAAVLDEKSFYPVWVKQAVARTPVPDNDQVDVLFKHEEKTVEIQPKPLEPDYALLFRRAIHIDGVSDDGLFINGRFYTIGSKLEAFAMMSTVGKRIVPVLDTWRGGTATFSVGTQKLSVQGRG